MSRQATRVTGKRVSTDLQSRPSFDEHFNAPLVPDITQAQKAMIHEQLSKTLYYAEVMSQSVTTLPLKEEKVRTKHAIQESPQVGQILELKRTESKSQKLGRRLKSLFMNDQSVKPADDDREITNRDCGRRCNRLPYLDDEEDLLYRMSSPNSKWLAADSL